MARTAFRSLQTVMLAALMATAWITAPSLSSAVTAAGINADRVDGFSAVGFASPLAKRKGKLVATSAKTGRLPNNIISRAPNADKLDGLDSKVFALGSHTHDAGAIVSGTLPEERIDPSLTRDGEVAGIVSGSDGAGSGLDADLLDGRSSSSFAPANQTDIDAYCAIAAASPATFSTVPCREFSTTLDGSPSLVVGEHNSMAIGAEGNPVISYIEDSNLNLRVVHCTNPTCAAYDPPVVVVATGDVGLFNSIAVGQDGFPIVSYQDLTDNDPHPEVRVVHCTNPSCSAHEPPRTLDQIGNFSFTSIAVGTDGNPVVSYYNDLGGELRVAKCLSPSCASNTSNTVDGGGTPDVGMWNSIAVGVDGLPVISSYDNGNKDLKVVHCTTPSCSATDPPVTLDSDGDVGVVTSIAIAADGNPIVSYGDDGATRVKIVHCTNPSCSAADAPRVISFVGDVDGLGNYTSIAVGTDGNPLVSFVTAGRLTMVRCTTSTCSDSDPTRSIDHLTFVQYFTSIAVGPDGIPVIAYHDATNHTLKFAHVR